MNEVKQKIATRDAYGQALVEIGKYNKDLVVLDADLSKSTKTAGFAKAYPERFINVGIAEQNMVGVAAGLAVSGKIPFLSSFAVFATGRAFEQIRNSVAYSQNNVKIAATHAGITVGEDGGTHQSVEDIAIMRTLPQMVVIVPCDATETKQAVKSLVNLDGPAYLRLGRLAVPQISPEGYEFHLGKGVLLQEGSDIVIFACGMMVSVALEAAQILAAEGIAAAVANIHTIKPLDTQFIVNLAKICGAAVTVEEHSIIGGLGSAVAETLAEHCPVPLARVGVEDVFGQSGSPAELLDFYGLTPMGVVDKVKKVLAQKLPHK
ncbi:MAG: transketolase family protein [Bacillota bacterium]|jgi:transketolase